MTASPSVVYVIPVAWSIASPPRPGGTTPGGNGGRGARGQTGNAKHGGAVAVGGAGWAVSAGGGPPLRDTNRWALAPPARIDPARSGRKRRTIRLGIVVSLD